MFFLLKKLTFGPFQCRYNVLWSTKEEKANTSAFADVRPRGPSSSITPQIITNSLEQEINMRMVCTDLRYQSFDGYMKASWLIYQTDWQGNTVGFILRQCCKSLKCSLGMNPTCLICLEHRLNQGVSICGAENWRCRKKFDVMDLLCGCQREVWRRVNIYSVVLMMCKLTLLSMSLSLQ